MTFRCPETFRVQFSGHPVGDETCGTFVIPLRHGQRLYVIASNGMGWEHVSVSRRDRCPTWEEMCAVKAAFWSPDDCVVQYHPPESDYVNNHSYCLHLWRPTDAVIPRPPSIMVGVKEVA